MRQICSSPLPPNTSVGLAKVEVHAIGGPMPKFDLKVSLKPRCNEAGCSKVRNIQPRRWLMLVLPCSFVCGNSSYASSGKLAFLDESTLLRCIGRRLATYNTTTSEAS